MNNTLTMLAKVTLIGLTLSGSTALAVDWTERTDVSGFFTTRYSLTDEAAYFHGDRDSGINDKGSFQGTKLGLTIRSQINDDLSVAMLLMSSASENDYNTQIDWAFASYTLSEAFTLRAGKIKFPVGLVNEYVDVGVTYPWISAPLLLYSNEPNGAQATREAYTGASLLWTEEMGDWTLGSDLFFGQVDLEGMVVKGLLGLTVRANWDDTVELQASAYEGEMNTDPAGMPMMAMMNEKTHGARLVGIKVDWHNIVAYAEAAQVTMDVTMMGTKIGDSDVWYATLGYRIGRFLPHFTRQEWDRDNGANHSLSTLGLAYRVTDSVVIKAEQSRIGTNNFATQAGLFNIAPSDGSTNLTSIAVDIIF
ncbi:MAG: hypothetical protein GXP14_03715 [Gammaproteobacteria bacterium]|nr:hypothetical protein [Gammaproteobacteria bacterium]